MEFVFTNEGMAQRADELVNYLRGPRLWIPQIDYPDYLEWTDKVHAQLKNEEKRATVVLSHGNVVGAIVYQLHKTVPNTVEIKNITVRPDMQGRHVASFLLRNAEIEGSSDYRASRVRVDSKARNTAIRLFLLQNGYRLLSTEDLYALGTGDDLVFEKATIK